MNLVKTLEFSLEFDYVWLVQNSCWKGIPQFDSGREKRSLIIIGIASHWSIFKRMVVSSVC